MDNREARTSVWSYADDPIEIAAAMLKSKECTFCRSVLLQAFRTDWEPRPGDLECDRTDVRLCPRCGWWTGHRYEKKRTDDVESTVWEYGSYGVLKNLSLTDISTPIEELRDYLAARYDSRNQVHPRLWEETVAAIFKDLGYAAEVTAYSGDGGIDVILTRSDERIGVQVKRYRGAIEAEQIRSFVGALVIGGYTRGAFVTTSRFRKGAKDAAESASFRGYPVELIDSHRLYEALGIAQSHVDRSPDEWLLFIRPRLKLFERYAFVESYYSV